jgi:methyl-accepting chemotaxis protein
MEALKKVSHFVDQQDLLEKFQALDKVQAIIEFNLDGTIINANENFLAALGYSLSDIQ